MQHIRNPWLDLVLAILTMGIYSIWVQHKQIEAMNAILGRTAYNFWRWLLLSIITLMLYMIYHEWSKSVDLALANKRVRVSGTASLILTALGLWFIANAMQQREINRFFAETT
jgi:hypothetical protein